MRRQREICENVIWLMSRLVILLTIFDLGRIGNIVNTFPCRIGRARGNFPDGLSLKWVLWYRKVCGVGCFLGMLERGTVPPSPAKE